MVYWLNKDMVEEFRSSTLQESLYGLKRDFVGTFLVKIVLLDVN